jgi:hypothetical protein
VVRVEGRRRKRRPPERVLGWREWTGLPDFGVRAIKAKLDTGARTSALHAFGIRSFVRDGIDMVRFEIHPIQRSSAASVEAVVPMIDRRVVRNSGGGAEERPVIETTLQIGEELWPIELTLTRRDEMGFRMLLGREALRDRAVVDAGSSFRAGRQAIGQRSTPPTAKEDEDE